MGKLVARFLMLLFVLSGCPWTSKIATVGQYDITQRDIDLRDQLAKVYFPHQTASAGLKQLTDAYIYAEILRSHNAPVTSEVLLAEQDRIDKQSLMPEMLARIKNIFGKDKDAYQRVFVLPIYVERVLPFEFFPKSSEIHAERFKIASTFFASVQNDPKKFYELAKQHGVIPQLFTVSLREGLQKKSEVIPQAQAPLGANGSAGVPPSIQQAMEIQQREGLSEEGKKWIEELIKPLEKGALIPKVIDQESRWLIVRYIGPTPKVPGSYDLDVVSFAKIDFTSWLEQEKAKIKINVSR